MLFISKTISQSLYFFIWSNRLELQTLLVFWRTPFSGCLFSATCFVIVSQFIFEMLTWMTCNDFLVTAYQIYLLTQWSQPCNTMVVVEDNPPPPSQTNLWGRVKVLYKPPIACSNNNAIVWSSLRAQTVLCGVMAPCYQGVGNKVPQLHTTQSEPLD